MKLGEKEGKEMPSPTHTRQMPKRPPHRQEDARKRPADNGLEQGARHRKTHARKARDQGKSKIHPSPHHQESRPRPKGTIQEMTAPANPRSTEPLPTHKSPESKTPRRDRNPQSPLHFRSARQPLKPSWREPHPKA